MGLESKLSPRRFYMMRHEMTFRNGKGLIQGNDNSADTQLNARGLTRAFGAGHVLDKLNPPYTRIICSGLDRTIDTAVMATGVPKGYTVDEQLNDYNFGKAEGVLTPTQLHALDANAKRDWGIEETTAFRHRVIAAVSRHLQECGEDEIPLFVVHKGTIRQVLAQLNRKVNDVANGEILQFTPHDKDGKRWNVASVTLKKGKLAEEEILETNRGRMTLTGEVAR